MKFLSTALLSLGALSTTASAQGFGDVANNVHNDFLGPLGDLLGAGGLILGISAIIMAGVTIFKMRSGHHSDPNASPARVGTLLVAGALLLALPATMGTGVETLFGSRDNTAQIGGELRAVQ